MKLSANLGFLWSDLALPDAVRAAAAAGFDAVEFHWPYDADADALAATLDETGLPVMGLNTARGDVGAGENGLCALPGREAEARDGIARAFDLGRRLSARNVHVMAGVAEGTAARDVFLRNLDAACELSAETGLGVLIEPLNPHDAPGYFHATTAAALSILDQLDRPEARLMFDCYHVGRTEAEGTAAVIDRLRACRGRIGHVQIAAVPDRGAPDHGAVDYVAVASALADLGWAAPVGAEYRPSGPTQDGLGWMPTLRAVG